jgi:broad specificity phosphatase PhoE
VSDVQLVVSSPLSRALRTADLVHPPTESSKKRRIAIEHFREINGKLLNAQRRPKSDLVQKFPTGASKRFLSWIILGLKSWNRVRIAVKEDIKAFYGCYSNQNRTYYW